MELNKKLDAQELKKEVEKILTDMGCSDILFPDPKDDLIVTIFNCKELTSFQADLPGWTYSGIHLDPSGVRGYKIDFKHIA